MHTLKLSLECKCFPIWYYDELGQLIDNDLPEELLDDKELDALLVKLQATYDSMFIDTPTEFRALDFKSIEDKSKFNAEVDYIENMLETKYGYNYIIINNIIFNA